MRRLILLAIIVITCFACNQKDENSMLLTGKVKGLKKGSLVLKKIEDEKLIVLDSIVMNGEEDFAFETIVAEPEMFYLQLDKLDGHPNDDNIPFFADKGAIVINTTLKDFGVDYTVTGSKNHDLLEQYRKVMKPVNDRNLDLIEETFKADVAKDSVKLAELEKKAVSLLRNKYFRALNFALSNKDAEIAPYIGAQEIGDANLKILDTLHSSLPENIKKSKYGKELRAIINGVN
ncbi:MAG: DUF4369 domain-containing protein [Flavobacteriaceae bacterium]|nr:DUF4369 domain-containing protein [Flavobacteriaceae bacterium]